MKKSKKLVAVTCSGSFNSKILWLFTKLCLKLAGVRSKKLVSGKSEIKEDYLKQFSGFVIGGGSDINPELYGEEAVAKAIQYDIPRDEMESEVIKFAIANKKPLLGICRGMQMINVVMKGSLYQEAKNVLENFLPNESLLAKFLGRREIIIYKNSKLFKILKLSKLSVNSIHHQAINKIGEGLRVSAKEENGLVQAIESRSDKQNLYIIGVQWHPELTFYNKSSRMIFKDFACNL